jgi:formylglycine-generating enzyme required for sulfatase activity
MSGSDQGDAQADGLSNPLDAPVDGSGDTLMVADDGMVRVSPGPFFRGCAPSDDACFSDERPGQTVTVSAFEIDRTEVTQQAYDQCVRVGACTPPATNYSPDGEPERPVIGVSWFQANTYCAWVHKRLPTEAEWEKAARGTDASIYPWGADPATCERAVFSDPSNCGQAPQAVASHPSGASPYGAFDMAGNAQEWCSDWYGDTYYQGAPTQDPTGPTTGTGRVQRGGAWDNTWWNIRASSRDNADPSVGKEEAGFRCAR